MLVMKTATSIKQVISQIMNAISSDQGRVSYVVTAKGDEVKTAFKVVNADQLIISNHLDGRINEEYPQELQPRDRTRLSSKLQVNSIAKNIRPAQLSDSGLSSHGSPIIGNDNVVESGNGRAMGVLTAYASGNGEKYKEYLVSNASLYGLHANEIEKMDRPVLVRVRLDDINRAKFAKDSNLSDLQDMSPSEKAFVDAENINGSLLELFSPSESGSLLARSNDAFIRSFMNEVGASAAAGLLTDDGRPTRQLVDRIQNAVFAKAYKNEALVKLVAEEPDPEMRNVLTALNVAANDFVQMQYISGDIHKQVVNDVSKSVVAIDSLDAQALHSLTEAIDLVRKAKSSGQSINEIVSQQGLFSNISPESSQLAIFIASHNRSAKRMGRAFKLMAETINQQLLHSQRAAGDLFGAVDITLSDVLSMVSHQLDTEHTEFQSIFSEKLDPTFAMLERSPTPTTGVGMFTFSRSIDDITTIIKSLCSDDRSFNQGQIIGELVKAILSDRMPQITALKEIKLIAGKTITEFNRRVEDKYAFSAGVAKALKSDSKNSFQDMFVKKVVMAGNGFDLKELLSRYRSSSNEVEQYKSASQLLDAIKPFLTSGRGSISFKLEGQKVVEAMVENKPFPSLMEIYGYANTLPESMKLSPESSKKEYEAALLAGNNLMIGIEDVLTKNRDDIKQATGEGSFRVKLLGTGLMDFEADKVQSALASSKMGYGSFKKDGYQMILNLAPATARQGVSALINGMLEPTIAKLTDIVDNILLQSDVTQEDADEWFSSISCSKSLISKWDKKYGNGAFKSDVQWAYKIAGGKLKTLKEIKIRNSGRSSASKINNIVNINPESARSVLAHEIGHHFEYSNENLIELVKEYLKSHMPDDGNPTLMRLRDATGNSSYEKNEIAIRDSLSSPYIGKVYNAQGNLSEISTSEVFSSAFEYLFDKNSGAKSVLNNDGLIGFAIGAIKGVFDGKY
ncbi:MAG: hypothetical protein ACRC6N_11200 [Plesiomonas sp.]|uniref:hypothetical protein n=1 Tax=Plesiomonas sp. TaxID=2486279 RepID=UPI003F403C41